MKKAILFTTMFTIMLVSLFCANKTKSFNIQGGYGTFAELLVEPIPAQTQAYIIGMPFNIEDNLVQYGNTENGRMIATWSMMANTTPIKLKISGDKLMHESGTSEPLDYILTLFYDIGYYDANGLLVNTTERTFTYDSSDAENPDFTTIFDSQIEQDSFIGSIDGSIYFMFTEKSSALLNPETGVPSYESFPGGNYSAEVVITLEAGK